MQKAQLNQADKTLIFYHEILKMKFFSSLMLKNFSSHLTWKLSWTNGLHYFNEREEDLTSRYKMVYHSAMQAMKHGSREQP